MKLLFTPQKRFVKTHSDEMGTYGTYVADVGISDEKGNFICWQSTVERFLSSDMAQLIDTEPLKEIVAKCKSVS